MAAEEERIPYKEGWRPPNVVSQGTLAWVAMHMLWEYGHNIEEALIVGWGTMLVLLSFALEFLRSPRAAAQTLWHGILASGIKIPQD